LRPTGKPGSPTQTPSRRPPIQSGAARRRNGRKKVFSTPHSFAPCGAYSRGRPHAQEEDDRKAAHHLAIGAARRRIARSITQLEQHAKKTLPERNDRPGSPTTTEENSQP
jgi:hypothetical protein